MYDIICTEKVLRLFYSLIKSNKILRKGAFAFSVSKLLTERNVNG